MDRPPVCQQLVVHPKLRVLLLVHQGALHLQLVRRVHQPAQLALLLQQGDHQVNLVHREERRVGLLEAHQQALCQQADHPEPQGYPEVKAGYLVCQSLAPKQMQ